MKVERIDHIHVKVADQPKTTARYEEVLGAKVLMEADFTDDYGMRVAYNPFPIGIELMEVTDRSKQMAKIYAAAPEGVFALSLKVPNIDEATAEMEAMGHALLMRYDFGEIKEALFDSKKTVGLYVELIEYAAENITDADDGGVSESGRVEPRTS
jgi:catechol 2,3-dioxygenase-like lactoylglutathione lyase family enzyme